MNRLYGLMDNFIDFKTIIQAALEKTEINRFKEVQTLIDYILNEPDEYGTNWYALMQDIPQILCYKKFDINSFFHISAAEELTIF